jgi:hypothetical protein
LPIRARATSFLRWFTASATTSYRQVTGGNPDETLSLELIAGTSAQNDAQGTGEFISAVRLIENRHVQS